MTTHRDVKKTACCTWLKIKIIHWKIAPEFHPVLVPMADKLGGPSGAMSAPSK